MENLSQPPRSDLPEVPGVPGIPDAALSALLDGRTPRADAPAPVQHLAGLLAALQAGPAADETAGLAVAMAEFRRRTRVPAPAHRSRRRRLALLAALLSAKTATVAGIAAVSLGGIATAAFTGKLPTQAQRLAHETIGAPAPAKDHSSPAARHSGTPVGPSASGPAAFGLCNAYAHATHSGSKSQQAVAFGNLVKAAGGAGNVASYCAAVPHPGAAESAAPHEHGMPSTVPADHHDGRPTAVPSPHPTGPPSHP